MKRLSMLLFATVLAVAVGSTAALATPITLAYDDDRLSWGASARALATPPMRSMWINKLTTFGACFRKLTRSSIPDRTT